MYSYERRADFVLLQEELPDYYEVIKHPMDFETVKEKLDKAEYETLKAVVTDIGQIFVNAKRCKSDLSAFNPPSCSSPRTHLVCVSGNRADSL